MFVHLSVPYHLYNSYSLKKGTVPLMVYIPHSPSINLLTSLYTSSIALSALTLRTFPLVSYRSTMGILSPLNVSNLFRMTSSLSSFRPLDLPLSSKRPVMVSSGQSRNSTNFTSAFPVAVSRSSHTDTFPSDRGKPSMRNFVLPLSFRSFAMPPSRRSTVISAGTICPAAILELMRSASSDPELRSARSRSPAERWAKSRREERSSHCVPFPDPGPPRTNTTV
mmetsp:Transcript_40363/g.121623  ORF Transcript_40363/g.121623 Transcript_40363/m.121623 type:complete len:223 (+) Transcript_40363:295-963(+)